MEVLIKLSDAIKTLKSMAVPLVRKLPSAQPERLTDYSFEESCTECPAYDTENHRCPRFNQVIRTALKDANLEPCENCISRQAAIDALAKMMPKSYTPDGSHPADEEIFREQEIFADCIKTLEILPSAQPEPRWIPVSERLPEPRVDVWVNSDIGQIQGYYEEHIGIWYASFGQGRDYLELIVTAWMPLPEPYRAERRTDE